VNRLTFLNNRYHLEPSSVDYTSIQNMHFKFLKFVYLMMQTRHYLIKYAQFCIYFR